MSRSLRLASVVSVLAAGVLVPASAGASVPESGPATVGNLPLFAPGFASGGTDGCLDPGLQRPGARETVGLALPCPELRSASDVGTGGLGNAADAPSGDWSVVASPNAAGAYPRTATASVSCVAPSDCWAVGYFHTGTAAQGLIQRWNGTAWALIPSPPTGNGYGSILTDVTCVSSTDCWAVGYYSTGTALATLTEHWDGTRWAVVGSPSLSTQAYLSDVTCVSSSECWAVGHAYTGITGAAQTLIERWNGSSWSIVESANTSVTEGNSLSAVTCVSATSCWALGSAVGRTLIERWDGSSWAIVSSPNNTAYAANGLSGVTCTSGTNCWAVGVSLTDNEWRTLIERWDGTSWTIVGSPNKALMMNSLVDVTCVSSSDCWAVGGYYPGTAWRTMAQHWDGVSWKVVASPSTNETDQNFLSAVTCVSARECWAIGSSWGNAHVLTLAERWDAAEPDQEPSWSIVISPNPIPIYSNVLKSVTCVSASECWAVGSFYPEPWASPKTLTLYWEGSTWQVVPSPNASNRENVLSDVTCTSSTDCWAVGHYYGDGAPQTLIEHWDGVTWRVIPSANTGSGLSNFLKGVTCASTSDCWAVGTWFAGSPSRTLVQHWDGSSWELVASPNPSSNTASRQRNELSAVTCTSASSCWAVGSYDVDFPEPDDIVKPKRSRALTMRWDGSSWAVVAASDTLPSEQQFLADVTCVSVADCWAVGYSQHSVTPQMFVTPGQVEVVSGARQTLIKRWDGTSWSIVDSPDMSAIDHNSFSGVTCASATNCWAVGSYDIEGVSQTLVQQWDGGSWVTVASPSSTGAESLDLAAVTCASSSDCWTVGSSHNGVIAATLAARYTGVDGLGRADDDGS